MSTFPTSDRVWEFTMIIYKFTRIIIGYRRSHSIRKVCNDFLHTEYLDVHTDFLVSLGIVVDVG